jgi:hypothetical protein
MSGEIYTLRPDGSLVERAVIQGALLAQFSRSDGGRRMDVIMGPPG